MRYFAIVLVLLGTSTCAKNQPCERNEDCPTGYLCVAAASGCIAFEQADLLPGPADLSPPPEKDLSGQSDGGGGLRWKTGAAALGTLAGPFSGPAGVCHSGTRLYVADSGNHRVLVYDSLADKAKPLFALGRADLVANPMPVSPPTARSLNHPTGLWCDDSGVIVADTDNSRVLFYAGSPGAGADADGVVGQPNLTSGDANRKGATAANSLSKPEDVFWDGERLYIADSGNDRVVGYAAADAMALKGLSAGAAQVLFGQKTFADKIVPANGSDSVLGRAAGVAVSGDRIAIVDGDFHRVMIYDVPKNFMSGTAPKADAAMGQSNLTNKASGVGPTKMNGPVTLRLDDTYLYLVDRANNRVLIYETDLPAAGKFQLAADFALGQPKIGAPMMPAASGAADLKGPGGVAVALVNGATHLVVSDAGNNRVQVFRTQ